MILDIIHYVPNEKKASSPYHARHQHHGTIDDSPIFWNLVIPDERGDKCFAVKDDDLLT